MIWTGRLITDHSTCSCVIGPEALCKYCSICMIIAFPFNGKTYNAIMLLLQLHILQITSINCFAVLQWSQRVSAFDSYQIRITILCLHFTITYHQNSIVALKRNAKSCLLRGHEKAFQRDKCLSEQSLPIPAFYSQHAENIDVSTNFNVDRYACQPMRQFCMKNFFTVKSACRLAFVKRIF